ncbi:MAG TPA: polysaccharide biosynthesis protein [Alphaproteobacteria bacterium]|nr:polysaccharide biosynthesis protein [Alphaproteobacteria bacterium]
MGNLNMINLETKNTVNNTVSVSANNATIPVSNFFEGKDILVTGGCGSIGSEIVRQLLAFNPKRIRILDNSETAHFNFNQTVQSDKIRNLVGDIRDRNRVMRAVEGCDIIFHAAALKHVPFCEYNPFEAVNTNIIGTQNLIDAATHHNVKVLVGISTDKAANPISTLGATKLMMEKLITNNPGLIECNFCCVRFGNVLNSVGSIIPIFKKQIAQGGPVTVTHKDMTRFFMSIDDAVKLVLKSAQMTESGEIFILKMDALKIVDLAEVMIQELAPKHGFKPQDIKIEYIGTRPGEKTDEILLTPEESNYALEKEDVFVLYNSIQAHYGKNHLSRDRSENSETLAKQRDYTSKNAPLLDKETIRALLYEKKIL